MKESATEH